MIYQVRPSACDMIGYPIFCYATYGCNFFCRDLWILLIIFRIVSVVSAGVSVLTEGVSVVTVVVSVVTVDVSVVSLMFLSCLKQVYESAMRLQDEHRGLKSLYSSNFDVADKVSTEIYCFSSKFDEL